MRTVKSLTSHSVAALLEAGIIALLIVGLITVPVLAAKGGNGGGKGGATTLSPSACTVDGNVVTGSDLPNDELVNFMITDSEGTWGWVLGSTDIGTWSVNVPPRDGPTTYEFAGRTYGPNGTKYRVFSSCSA